MSFATGSSVTNTSSSDLQASASGDTLSILTPGDNGAQQDFSVSLKEPGGTVDTLTVHIQSGLPTQFENEAEADSGSPPTQAALTVTGLGANNTISSTALSFGVAGAPAIDASASSGVLLIPGQSPIDLASMWTLDASTNTLNLSSSVMTQIQGALGKGEAQLGISLVSKDHSFTASYSGTVLNPSAVLDGKIVDANGNAVTSLAGRKIGLVGNSSGIRRVGIVNSDGTFTFASLVPDTYDVSLLDLNYPNYIKVTAVISPSATTVNLNVTYATPASGQASALHVSTLFGGGLPKSFVSGIAVGNGKPTPQRSLNHTSVLAAATTAPCQSSVSSGETVFTAASATQDQTIKCDVNFVVPKGTSQTQVTITVTSAEYPTFTQEQSIYNDTWSYSLFGLPGGALSDAGAVNTTHYSTGSITKKVCVDTSTTTANGSITIGGQASATNVGDSILTTMVMIDIKTTCDNSISVQSAVLSSPNSSPYYVIKGKPDVGSAYVSFPQINDENAWGLPLDVTYSPATAQITDIRLGVLQNGNLIVQPVSILNQADSSPTQGKVHFSNLLVPRLVGSFGGKKVGLLIQLVGAVAGTSSMSDGTTPNVTFEGNLAITPLTLAGDNPALAARRYGPTTGRRDNGNDSWATDQTIQWLLGRKGYRFNDISALHVAKMTYQGSSVLGHKGHSNGQQIDLRYADGIGGYSDGLGGDSLSTPTLLATLNKAEMEVNNGAVERPNLVSIQNWISANRALLTQEAASTQVTEIFYGAATWFQNMLVYGQFADGKSIPNSVGSATGTWTAKPAKARPVAGHESHWHISLMLS